MKVTQNKLEKSQIELEFTLTPEEFEQHTAHALEHLKKHVKMDGFRQGKVPDKMAEERIGNENLLMEAGDHAVQHVYSDYVAENKLEPVGQPEVSIVKIAKGSEFVFKAKITLLPEIELPDYKEIAKKIKGKEISVTEDEVQEALNYLQKSRAKFITETKPAEKNDFVQIVYNNKEINEGKDIEDKFILGDGGFMKGFEDSIVGMKEGDEKEFSVKFPDNSPRKDLAGKEGSFKVKMKQVQRMELPELSDQFAKDLGVFDTLVALKESIKEGIGGEKKEAEKQRRRGEILDKISEKIILEMPDSVINYEKERLLEDLKNRVAQNFKITFENYLATIKQTEQELKETFSKEAEKRIKNFLVLRQLGKQEGINVTDQEVEEEVTKSIKNYSKEQLSKIDIEQFKEYTKGVIYNEKVFAKLESFSS